MKGFVKALLACCFFFIVLFAISSYVRFSAERLKPTERIKTAVDNTTTVSFDSTGSLFIKASSESDLAFSMGFAHAETHSWQLFLNQQMAEGKVSTYFGESWLQTDALIKALEIEPKAKTIFNNLSENNQTILKAYSAGINNYYERNQRSLDIRFAQHDLTPSKWEVHTPISLWLLELTVDNPAINQDALIVALGLELETNQKDLLFSALPNTKVADLSAYSSNENLLDQILSIHSYWIDLSIKSGLKSMGVGNFSIAHTNINNTSGIISARSEPDNGFKNYLVSTINLSDQNLEVLTQVGTPIFWMKANKNTNQKYAINRSGDGLHSLNLLTIEADTRKKISPRAIPLNLDKEEPKLVEFHFFDKKHFIFTDKKEWEKPNRTALVLADNASLKELITTYNKLLEMSFKEKYTQNDGISFYEIIGINEEQLISYTEKSDITLEPITDLLNLSSSNTSYATTDKVDGFIISHGSMFVKNEQSYFNGWQNDPFTIEHLQTELLVDQQQTVNKLSSLLTSSYSSFAAKTLIDIEPLLVSSSESNDDIKVASAYFDNWNYIFDENAAAATIFEYFYQKLIENIFSDEISPELFEMLKQQSTLLPVLTLFALNNSFNFFDNKQTTLQTTKDEIVLESLNQAMISVRREFGNQTEDWRWENYLARRTPNNNDSPNKSISTYHGLMLKPVNKATSILSKGHWSTPNHVIMVKNYQTQNSQVINNTSLLLLTDKESMFKGMNTDYSFESKQIDQFNISTLDNNATIRTLTFTPEKN